MKAKEIKQLAYELGRVQECTNQISRLQKANCDINDLGMHQIKSILSNVVIELDKILDNAINNN